MLQIAAAIAIFVVLFYVWLTWNHGYWRKKKIPYLEPLLFYGNVKDAILLKRNRGVVYDELYRQGEGPVLGIFSMRQPQWMIRDPNMVKIITTNEFHNFRENNIYTEPNDFFLSTNVLFISGEKWKKQRSIITPALTMSKLKHFVPHMVDVAREMITYMDKNQGKAMEAKAFGLLFTAEIAMNYVYGVRCNSYENPNSEYMNTIMEILDPSGWNGFKFILANLCPPFGHFFKIGLTPKSFLDFYLNVVKEAVDYRKENNLQRKDFLQYLIDSSGKNDVPELSIHQMTGLTMNIAADASETTSQALTSVIDALIRYPDHQEKLRNEIDQQIQSFEDITYENINSIRYLDAFISESLRILTAVPLLEKRCTGNCDIEFEGKTYSFQKGDTVSLPIYSIHMDSKYFPNPNEFNPDRFLESESEPLGFTPFGSGPKMCIGRKLAYLMMKVFLCALLKNYQIFPKDDIAPPIEYEPKGVFFFMIKGGVWFKFKKL